MSATAHPATRTVHTPTGPVHCCSKHAAKLMGLMSFIGAHTSTCPTPVGAQCSNCVNETKAREVA